MVRDMSLKVRVEAFDALGEISMVSEEILLQTLSKKLLSVSLQGSKLTLQRHGLKEMTYSGLCSTKPVEIPASNSAGVFVHGLEDEFSEVSFIMFVLDLRIGYNFPLRGCFWCMSFIH